MGLISWLFYCNYAFTASGKGAQIIVLVVILAVSVAVFAALCIFLRVREINELWAWLTKRKIS
jgi:hypothetical protein